VNEGLSRRAWKAVAYPPLSDMSPSLRREFHEALLDAEFLDDLPGKWQGALIETEANMPELHAAEPRSADRARELRALYEEVHAYASERDHGDTRLTVRRMEPRSLDSELMLLAQGLAQGTQRVTGYPYRTPEGLSAAGKRLDEFLRPLGYTIDHTDEARTYAYSTDLVPWFTGKTPDGRHDNEPMDEEIAACWTWFEREVALVEPRGILLLGHPAARHFLNRYADMRIGRRRPALAELRGQSYPSTVGSANDLTAVVAYHPSAAWGSLQRRAQESYAAAQPLLRTTLAR